MRAAHPTKTLVSFVVNTPTPNFVSFAFSAVNNFRSEREAREETPHFSVGVYYVSRWAEDTFHDFLFAAGPDMAGAGQLP